MPAEKYPASIRKKVIEYCLHKGYSVRKTAGLLSVPRSTVSRWVTAYREQGEKSLLPVYTRPAGRLEPEVEKIVCRMREKNPRSTIAKVRKSLQSRGISISSHGIHSV
ncbi:MAG: helix-turn-helix domain-containing protein, partial [Candidatus Aegiribacteria sp.]|nr:helix-turn-helix domain-containing protein [Candidatus Aegiribacteria sp.]MBD3294191.1 helix-turn-helix domain-containing protein [Candidatus Fermentibacteria bacterium]